VARTEREIDFIFLLLNYYIIDKFNLSLCLGEREMLCPASHGYDIGFAG
jgi:hypothetical protein